MVSCSCSCSFNEDYCKECKEKYLTSEAMYIAQKQGWRIILAGYVVWDKTTEELIGMRTMSSGFQKIEKIDAATLEDYTENNFINANLKVADYPKSRVFVNMVSDDIVLSKEAVLEALEIAYKQGQYDEKRRRYLE